MVFDRFGQRAVAGWPRLLGRVGLPEACPAPGLFSRRCGGVSPREGAWFRFAEVQGEPSVGGIQVLLPASCRPGLQKQPGSPREIERLLIRSSSIVWALGTLMLSLLCR